MIWAASQIVSAHDVGIATSRFIRATPYEILRFIGRGTSLRDYQRLRAALDRLQTTSIVASIRETTGRRLHRVSLINECNGHRKTRVRLRTFACLSHGEPVLHAMPQHGSRCWRRSHSDYRPDDSGVNPGKSKIGD